MSNKLQQQYEDMKTTRQILTHLQELYDEQSRATLYEVSKRLFKTKICDGLTMIKDLKETEKLGMSMNKELQIDLILQSLTDSYA